MLDSLISDPNDPHALEWGDERERASVLAAYTRGFLVSMYAAYALSMLLALFGHVVLALVALVLVAWLPALVTMRDTQRRGVDLYALTALAPRSRQRLDIGVLVAVLVVVFGATLYFAVTGHALVPTPSLPRQPLIGLCIGGLFGAGFGVVGLRRTLAQAAQRRALDDQAEDD